MADIPILRFALPFICGIVLSLYFATFLSVIVWISISFLICICIFHYRLKKRPHLYLQSTCSLLIYLTFIGAGYLVHSVSVINRGSNFYHPGSQEVLIIEYDKCIKSNADYLIGEFYLIRRLKVDTVQHAKFRVRLELEGIDESPKLGNQLIIQTQAHAFKANNLPFGFEQKTYYASQNIDYQIKLKRHDWMPYANCNFNIYEFASKLRQRLTANFAQGQISADLAGFLTALTLGDRTNLESEVKESFIQTGSMHVLAVSGLHVGVLYVVMINLLQFRRKKLAWLKAVIILTIIWLYALITGLGNPVQRAALMLSILLIAKIVNRQSSNYNSVFVSAIILLMANPLALFTVSFQFSFLALLSIMLCYTKVKTVLLFKSSILDKIWSLAALGISAQILTFPLSIYYFNQFPPSFILSNILIVPYVIILFHFGIFYLILGVYIPFFSQLVENYMEILYGFILTANDGISALPFAQITGIHYSKIEVFMCYFLMLILMLLIVSKRTKIFALLFAVVGTVFIKPITYIETKNQLIFFKFYRYKNVLLKTENEALFIADVKLINNDYFMEKYFFEYLEYYRIKKCKIMPLEVLKLDIKPSDNILIVSDMMSVSDVMISFNKNDKLWLNDGADIWVNLSQMEAQIIHAQSWELIKIEIH